MAAAPDSDDVWPGALAASRDRSAASAEGGSSGMFHCLNATSARADSPASDRAESGEKRQKPVDARLESSRRTQDAPCAFAAPSLSASARRTSVAAAGESTE